MIPHEREYEQYLTERSPWAGSIVKAVREGVLESTEILPSIDKVCMEAIAGRIAIGEDETSHILHRCQVESELGADGDERIGVRLGTHAALGVASKLRVGIGNLQLSSVQSSRRTA
jgi:hypothetical protein